MINSKYEAYCNVCGLVYNDYLKYDELRKGMSPFVPAWKANFPQTINPYINVRGRLIMKRAQKAMVYAK